MADEKTNKRLLLSERTAGRMFDMYEAASVMDLFVDGQGRLVSGPQVTKTEFFRTVDVIEEKGQKVEVREVYLRLVMPTAVFIESAGNALAALGGNLKQFDEAAGRIRAVMTDAVKKVQDVKL
jgi:hypothetical protein